MKTWGDEIVKTWTCSTQRSLKTSPFSILKGLPVFPVHPTLLFALSTVLEIQPPPSPFYPLCFPPSHIHPVTQLYTLPHLAQMKVLPSKDIWLVVLSRCCPNWPFQLPLLSAVFWTFKTLVIKSIQCSTSPFLECFTCVHLNLFHLPTLWNQDIVSGLHSGAWWCFIRGMILIQV